jgi:hypothetical protein
VIVANALTDNRTIIKNTRPGRRSKCRCGQKETHYGAANNVVMMGGCEICVRRWVKNPRNKFNPPQGDRGG